MIAKKRRRKRRRVKPRRLAARKRAPRARARKKKLIARATPRATPRVKKSKRKETRSARARRKEFDHLKQQVRMQKHIIRDLEARTRAQRFFKPEDEDAEEAPEKPFIVPDGARIVGRDDEGKPSAFEMPDMVDEWDDVEAHDWYDEIEEGYGDYEDTDAYGDDAT